MKKLIVGATTAMMVFGLAGFASASTVSDSSSLTSSLRARIRMSVHNTNDSTINNSSVSSSSSSGGNTIVSSDDQTGSMITTGNADAAVAADNSANNNVV